ncbi:MAG TPA: hypothetical protein VE402_04075, partial [Candidatus Angelobacter sp.]|nr:hypothetical protein [Candidatus Angelobacter sp.]
MTGANPPSRRPLLRLWWTSLQRRWRSDTRVFVPAFVTAILLGQLLLILLNRSPATLATLHLFFWFLAGNILILPIQSRGRDALSALRVSLLPYDRPRLLWVRLALGNQLRLLMIILNVSWVPIVIPMERMGFLVSTVVGMEVITLLILAATLSEFLETALTHGRYRHLNTFAQAMFVGAAVLCLRDNVLARIHHLYTRAPGHLPWLLGGAGDLLGDTAALLVLLATFVIGLRAWSRFGLSSLVLSRVDDPRSHFSRTLRAAGVLAGGKRAQLAKDFCLLFRVPAYRGSMLGILIVCAAGFGFGVPFLVGLAQLGWVSFVLNSFGVDLFGRSLPRYDVLGLAGGEVARPRHFAVLVVQINITALAAGLVWAVRGIVVPILGPPDRSMYLASFVTGSSLLLWFTVAGDRISMWKPYPVAPRFIRGDAMNAGPIEATLLALLILGLTIVAGVAIFPSVLDLARAMVPGAPGGGVPLALLLLSVVLLASYALIP